MESQILGLGELLEGEGRLPSALNILCDNLRGREDAIANNRLSGLERELKRRVEEVADALRAAKAVRPGNSRGGNSRLASTGAPGPPVVAPIGTGGIAPDERTQAAQDGTPPPPIPPTPPPPPPPPPLPPPPPPPPPLDDHGAGGEEGPAPLRFVRLDEYLTSKSASATLAEAMWQRDFRRIYEASTREERAAMDAGLGRAAGTFAQSIPMAGPFRFKAGNLQRMLRRYLSVPQVDTPHRHFCGCRGEHTFHADNVRHIGSCHLFGRSIETHDAVKFALAHALHQCGVTASLPAVEGGVSGDGADPYGRDVGREPDWKADLAFFDQHSGVEYLVDVAIVNVDSHTSIGRFSGLGSAERLLEAEEERRRRNPTVVERTSGSGNIKKFVPFVMSSFGGLGPAAREFLTMAYRTARRSECFTLGVNHRALQTTWNTLTAATYWDARISVACSQADAEFQGRIIANDFSEAWPTFGRQPHPNPNFAPFDPLPLANQNGVASGSRRQVRQLAGRGVGGERRPANDQAPVAAGAVGLAGGADVIAAAMAAVAAAEERERGVAGEPRLQGHLG